MARRPREPRPPGEPRDPDEPRSGRRLAWLVAALALALLAAWLVWPAATATLSGQVTRNGGPAAGGTVTVTGADGARVAAAVGPDGRYTVGGLAPGRATVQVVLQKPAVFKMGAPRPPPPVAFETTADLTAGANHLDIPVK